MRGNGGKVNKLRIAYVAIDITSLLLSFVTMTSLGLFTPSGRVLNLIMYLILAALIYWVSGIYNRPAGKSRLQETITTLSTSLVMTIAFVMIFGVEPIKDYSLSEIRDLCGLYFIIFIPCFILRLLVTEIIDRKDDRKETVETCVAVGTRKSVDSLSRVLRESKNVRVRYEVSRRIYLDNIEYPEISLLKKEIRDAFDSLDNKCVILAIGEEKSHLLSVILRECFRKGIPIRIAPDMMSFVTRAIRLKDIYGEPFVDLTSPAMSDFTQNVKRLADVVTSLIAIILLVPFMAVIALAVIADSPGSPIYSQTRLGYHMREFPIYKFRSMVKDAENGVPKLSRKNDPRVTRVGRVLRRYHLDELPQLWNVLRGDMSLVGPRPERAYFADILMRETPEYVLTSQVRPGLTSWGMVRFGYASEIREMKERLHYDLLYVSNMSLLIDMKIIIYTVRNVLSGKGI